MNKSILKPVLASLALLVAGTALTPPTLASGGSGSGSTATAPIRLEAKMRSGRTEAKVAWRSDRGRIKVQAEIYAGKPSTQYTVTHKGVTIATFTTDSFGNGKVEMERSTLAMAAGDSVAVGALKGTLVRIR